jgi:hypothetical protein
MQGGKRMAKQLDCTTSIKSTQNDGIHGIHFGLHTTFSRLSRLASKRKPGKIMISAVDWITSKSNHSNRQMPYESCSPNSISGLAMIVGFMISHISSEHYSTGIFSNIPRSVWHISHFRRTANVNRWAFADSEGRRIYSKMNTDDWWWNTQVQVTAGATIGPVIFASDKTHLTNFLGHQIAWQLYLTVGNIRKDIRRTPQQDIWFLVVLIPCAPKGAKNIDEAGPSAVGTVVSELRRLGLTGPGLKCDCADGFQ